MSVNTNQEEICMTTPELIRTHGYVPETHHIWTKDGYCLVLHRILPPKSYKNSYHNRSENNVEILNDKKSIEYASYEVSRKEQIPVLIYHGLLSSSADWVLLGPGKALAYILCDNGYDVWLGNARGNVYSTKHVRYTTKDREFWNFSWHEIGYYDLPAAIDYILEKTGHTELNYVGYSQGTTAFYVMASEKSEYNKKVKGMISLAPVAFLSNQRSPLLKFIVPFYGLMEWGSSYCNIHHLFASSRLKAPIVAPILRRASDGFIKTFWVSWFSLIAGSNSNKLEEPMLSLILRHFPAGSSPKQLIHYCQSILSGSFRKFDYGAATNLKIYGSRKPPKYDLKKVKTPVAVFYSENDFLADAADVEKLIDKLPNVTKITKFDYPKFNHIDFMWGRDANTLLYKAVLKILKAMR